MTHLRVIKGGWSPPDESWMSHAACAGSKVDFFPEPGRGMSMHAAWAAPKRLCASCPVRAECLEYALATGVDSGGQDGGIWGGTDYKERRHIRRAQRHGGAA